MTDSIAVEVVEEDEQELKFDPSHGFQNEPGFQIDDVVGEIRLKVVMCHSLRRPQPKQRVVMLMPDGESIRVHDYVGVSRAHGVQVVHDRWSLVRVGKDRVLEFFRRLVRGIGDLALARLSQKLGG